MARHPVFVTRKFPPSVGGMETLAAGVWRSVRVVRPDSVRISHGGSNRMLVWWVPVCLARLIWLCLTGQAEYVLCGDALMNALCAPVLRIFQVPSATMIHGLDITYGSRLYSSFVIPPLRRAALVVANSAATARRAVELGTPENRISVLRLGIESPPASRPGRQEARIALRRKLGLPDDAKMLLALGRLVPRKGVRWFTESVLPQLDDDVHYLIAGQGPEEASVQSAAKAAGVAERVHLLGLVTDEVREELMAAAHIFVAPNILVPGDIEGFGLVAVEAAMRDTIVVAAELEGLMDAVTDGETGILLPPGDARAWASRLADLLADPGELASLGDQFGAKAREIYDEQAMGQELCALLGIGVTSSAQQLKTRVAVVGPAYPYKGGAVHHTTELVRQLAVRHFSVTLESWRAQYPRFLYPGELMADEPDVPPFEPTRYDLSWRRPDGWVRHGARIGRSYDLVILQLFSTFQAVPYLILARQARRHGAQVAVIAHNVSPHETRAADRRLVSALLNRVDNVLVHNSEQAKLASSMTRVRVRTATLPPHFPVTPAPGSERHDHEVRHRLLFFGFVRPYKGLDVLIRAIAEANVTVSLTVAGEFWNTEEQTSDLVRKLGLEDRVDLRPGYVGGSAVRDLFKESDALVLPYRKATGSQNTLLSFMNGRPVIVTRTGSLPDAVTDGVDGIICRPDDVADLARAIDRFYQPGEPSRLRANVKTADWAPLWDAYIEALAWDKAEDALASYSG